MSIERLKDNIISTLTAHLRKEANPDEEGFIDLVIQVPKELLEEDPEDPRAAFATVRYVVKCPSEKTHTVKVRFQYNKNGEFIKNSLTYV